MITCKEFPNKTFSTRQDMIKHLVENVNELISIKKSNIHKGCEKGSLNSINAVKFINGAEKGIGFQTKEGFLYPVISTTRYCDSHKDVHLDGCFTKTVKEQQGKVYYALDHELKWNSILAWQKDVTMFVQNIPWAAVGKNYEGTTEALVFEIKEEAIRNKEVLQAIKDAVSEFENSIRMQYFDVFLAVKTNEKGMEEYNANYEKYIDSIANKDVVNEDGYFWGVKQLGIHKEGSLVIAGGSNDATGIITNQTEPGDHSESNKNEPSTDTQIKEQLKQLLTKFD